MYIPGYLESTYLLRFLKMYIRFFWEDNSLYFITIFGIWDFFEETSRSFIIAWLVSYKLLQINYYTFILNMYVLILFGRDYTISELFGFFHRLMLALLPIYLSTKIFLDAYQIFFWKRYTKTKYLWALFRAIATFTRPLFWSIAFRNLISCLLSLKDYCFSTWNLIDSLVLVLQFLFSSCFLLLHLSSLQEGW